MQNQTKPLILAAEREAQMVSAFARFLVAISAIVIFLSFGGLKLPIALFVLSFLLTYAFVSALSAVLSLPRFFRSWWGILFTAIDGVALALLIGFVLKGTGMSPDYAGAVPGFVFIFPIMMLATMRYTVGPILVAFGSFALTSVIVFKLAEGGILAPDPTTVGKTDLSFFFGDVQNATRWWLVVTVAVLGILAVLRRRKTLETAISLGQKTANLSRYLPEPVANLVAEQGVGALTRGRRQNVTVLFVDIRGFTAYSETTTPEMLGELLSEFRSRLSDEVERHSGIVDKFIGDAIMAVFGVPKATPDDAKSGLACANAIIEAIAKWNDERQSNDEFPIEVSMGLHFGDAFAGAVGTEARMEFTVLGDTVNVAARLQEVSKNANQQLVVSEVLLIEAGISPAEDRGWHAMAEASIRGRHGAVPHYGIVKN